MNVLCLFICVLMFGCLSVGLSILLFAQVLNVDIFCIVAVPHTLILNGQNTYTISQRDNITFRCESTGIPVPQIWWFHHDQMQKAGEQGSSTLTITSAKKSDTGTYTCEGKNDAGVDMDTVVLQVQGKLCYKVVITWLVEPAVRGFTPTVTVENSYPFIS